MEDVLYRDACARENAVKCIREFLDFHDFHRTAETLDSELRTQKQGNGQWTPETAIETTRNVVKELLVSFIADKELKAFWKMWKRYVPRESRQNAGIEIEFLVHIYAVVQSSNKTPEDGPPLQQEITELKNFIGRNGASLAESLDAAALFALPYITRPRNHSLFQHLFEEKWIDELIEKLDRFLETNLPMEIVPPRLISIFAAADIPSLTHRDQTENKIPIAQEHLNETAFENKGLIDEAETNNRDTSESHGFNDARPEEPLTAFAGLQSGDIMVYKDDVDWSNTRPSRNNRSPSEIDSFDPSTLKERLEKGSLESICQALEAVRADIECSSCQEEKRREKQQALAETLFEGDHGSSLFEGLLSKSSMPLTVELFYIVENLTRTHEGRCSVSTCSNVVQILIAALTATHDCDGSEETDNGSERRDILERTALSSLRNLSPLRSCAESMIALELDVWIITALPTIHSKSHAADLLVTLLQSPDGKGIIRSRRDRLLRLYDEGKVEEHPYMEDGNDGKERTEDLSMLKIRELMTDKGDGQNGERSAGYRSTEQTVSLSPRSGTDKNNDVCLADDVSLLENQDQEISGGEQTAVSKEEVNNVALNEDLANEDSSHAAVVRPEWRRRSGLLICRKGGTEIGSKQRRPRIPHTRSFSADSSSRRQYSVPTSASGGAPISAKNGRCRSRKHQELLNDYQMAFSARRELPRTPNLKQLQ